MPGDVAVALRHVADAAADLLRAGGDVEAEHLIRPLAGVMKPSSDLIIVLLPAPFGPSRPTAPIGKTALTSARARFFRTRR
jgi:hypothetical protein